MQRKTIYLLNEFVGAALAANDHKSVVFFAAKAAPTKTDLIQYKFSSVCSVTSVARACFFVSRSLTITARLNPDK